MRAFKLGFLLSVGLLLAACGNRATGETPTTQVYRPPTSAPIADTPQEAEPVELTAESRPSPTPLCDNNLIFVEDVTIPDESVVAPGETLDKRWRVENAGSCNWDERYQVKLIAGPDMGASPQQALYPALSDSDLVIRMNFTAPEEPGAYRSAWQAFDPQDNPFGDTFFIDIVVAEGEEG